MICNTNSYFHLLQLIPLVALLCHMLLISHGTSLFSLLLCLLVLPPSLPEACALCKLHAGAHQLRNKQAVLCLYHYCNWPGWCDDDLVLVF